MVLQNPLLWLCIVALPLCFWCGFTRWKTASLIADTPASRVRSAAQGYIEVCGVACNAKGGGNPAALSRRPSVWWSYKIEEPQRQGRGWRTVESGVSEETFLLKDDSGYCVVDPEGAQVYGAERLVWYGEADTPPAMGTMKFLGALAGNCRLTELRIAENTPLEIIGEFHTLGDVAEGNAEQDSAALLRQWKLDQAALLRRFDTNHDGVLSTQEWEQARAAARAQVSAEQSKADSQGALNLLARPSDGRTFLMAANPLAQVARRARAQSVAAWSGFVVSAGLLAWLLTHS